MSDWRDYLTEEEAAEVKASDEAKAAWQATAARRAFIMNRAIQRKRYAEKASPQSPQPQQQ